MAAPILETHPKISSYADIVGWFEPLDRATFDAFLAGQDHEPGVLAELGAYQGRSAVAIGDHRQPDEEFVVVDLFGTDDVLDTTRDRANLAEVRKSYPTLTRDQFEHNYLSLHDTLPTVVQGLSSAVVDHVAPGTVRFLHVDASHVYDQVRVDVQNARELMRPGGIVVFDDYRSAHTPGVSAAVWQAVCTGDLTPVALTTQKFYGVFGDSSAALAVARDLVSRDPAIGAAEEQLLGHTVLRLWGHQPKPKAVPKPSPPPPPRLSDNDVRRVAEQLRVAVRVELRQQFATNLLTARARRFARRQANRAKRLST